MKLILGNGLLGSEFHKQTGWSYICRKEHGIDFADIETYKSYLRPGLHNRVDTVINCIAQTNTVNESDEDIVNDWEINYKGVMNLVDTCNKYNIKVVHISTDYVYAKSGRLARERDVPIHYDNVYTLTKLLADSYIQARCKNCLILRSSFKPNPFPYDYAWIDLIGNFDYIDVISKLMLELIEYDAQGVFNVGTEVKTLFDLAKRTKKNVKPLFKPEKFIDSNDISMNVNKMENFLKIKRGKRTNEFRFNS